MNYQTELFAMQEKYESDLRKLYSAIGHRSMDISGGFVESVCHHINSMKGGIARLLLSGIIDVQQASGIMGLSQADIVAWIESGIAAKDGQYRKGE